MPYISKKKYSIKNIIITIKVREKKSHDYKLSNLDYYFYYTTYNLKLSSGQPIGTLAYRLST